MEQLTLNLTKDEINQILDALGDQPYKLAFQLINKIRQQAQAQIQPQNAEPLPDKDNS